jgi:predicted nucleic acid-binding protein
MAGEPYILDTNVIMSLAVVNKTARASIVAALTDISIVALEVDDELLDGVKRGKPLAVEARDVGRRMQQGPEDDLTLIERGDELREEIAKPSDRMEQHLGEAGSAALAEQLGGTLVTDDGSGKDLARLTGVALLNTAGLLRELVRRGAVTCADARVAYDDIIAAGRWVDPRAHFAD